MRHLQHIEIEGAEVGTTQSNVNRVASTLGGIVFAYHIAWHVLTSAVAVEHPADRVPRAAVRKRISARIENFAEVCPERNGNVFESCDTLTAELASLTRSPHFYVAWYSTEADPEAAADPRPRRFRIHPMGSQRVSPGLGHRAALSASV